MNVDLNKASNSALNWLVAVILHGDRVQLHTDALLDGVRMPGLWVAGLKSDPNVWVPLGGGVWPRGYDYCENWSLTGPLMDRYSDHLCEKGTGEHIGDRVGEFWCSGETRQPDMSHPVGAWGHDRRVAFIRWLCKAHFGKHADVPEELCK